MIDTISLNIKHPRLLPGSPLLHHQATADQHTGISVEGPSNELVTLRRGQVYKQHDLNVRSSAYGLTVTSSLARRPDRSDLPNVFPPSTQADLVGRLGALYQRLSSLGVEFDVNEALVSRLDLFHDFAYEHPTDVLAQLVQARGMLVMSPSDLAAAAPLGRRRFSSEALLRAPTYGFMGEESATVLYSKSAQIASTRSRSGYKDVLAARLGSRSVLRAEHRMLCGRTVKSHARVRVVHDLVDRWDELPDVLEKRVVSRLNLDEPPPATRIAMSPEAVLRVLEKNGRIGLKDALLALAAEGVFARFERSPDTAMAELRAQFKGRMKPKDLERLMSDLINLATVGGYPVSDAQAELAAAMRSPSFAWPHLDG